MIGNEGTELKCLVVKLHLPKVLSLLIRKGYLRLTTSTELLMDCCVGLFCCCFFKKTYSKKMCLVASLTLLSGEEVI